MLAVPSAAALQGCFLELLPHPTQSALRVEVVPEVARTPTLYQVDMADTPQAVRRIQLCSTFCQRWLRVARRRVVEFLLATDRAEVS